MNHFRWFLLLFATVWAVGQTSQLSKLPNGPEALVRSLYQQVVARHPTGLPRGADRKVFAPYLSMALLHRIDLADDCARDWVRQDQERMLGKDQVPEKAPFGWAESGLFSGAYERTEPLTFQIERTESEEDGSIRVYVSLSGGAPNEKSWIWEVAARVARENGGYAIDDVIYLKDEERNTEDRLSEVLANGCDGTHWVGQ